MKKSKLYLILILTSAIYILQSAFLNIQSSSEPPAAPEGMVLIPAGEFIMGSNGIEIEKALKDTGGQKRWYSDEEPKTRKNLSSFYIDIYEVTNEDYKKFDSTHSFPSDRGRHPAVNITWDKAEAYCKWAGKRLPKEEEWEKAARGHDGRIYPWGDEFNKSACNSYESGFGGNARVGQFTTETSGATAFGGTTEVGIYKDGKSPYGVYDMGGNVWEWTDSWYNKERNLRTIKGGSWLSPSVNIRSAIRLGENPNMVANDYGFRCVTDYRSQESEAGK